MQAAPTRRSLPRRPHRLPRAAAWLAYRLVSSQRLRARKITHYLVCIPGALRHVLAEARLLLRGLRCLDAYYVSQVASLATATPSAVMAARVSGLMCRLSRGRGAEDCDRALRAAAHWRRRRAAAAARPATMSAARAAAPGEGPARTCRPAARPRPASPEAAP